MQSNDWPINTYCVFKVSVAALDELPMFHCVHSVIGGGGGQGLLAYVPT